MSDPRAHIEEYFLGKLDGDELISFEKEMENDPDFKLEIEELRLIHNLLIDVKSRSDLTQKVHQMESSLPPIPRPPTPLLSRWRNWISDLLNSFQNLPISHPPRRLALGSLTIIIVIVGLTAYSYATYSNVALAQQYFDTPKVPAVMGDMLTLAQADELIRKKSYAEAEQVLREIRQEQPVAELFLASVYFSTKDFKASQDALDNIDEEDKLKLPPIANEQQVDWNSLMIDLAQARTEEQLEDVIKSLQELRHPDKEKLLQKINSSWRWFLW